MGTGSPSEGMKTFWNEMERGRQRTAPPTSQTLRLPEGPGPLSAASQKGGPRHGCAVTVSLVCSLLLLFCNQLGHELLRHIGTARSPDPLTCTQQSLSADPGRRGQGLLQVPSKNGQLVLKRPELPHGFQGKVFIY